MQQLHTVYLDKYDFNGLVRALRDKAESPSAAPGLKQMLRSAEQLAALKEWLDLALRRYTRQHPLMVRELTAKADAQEVGVYLNADGRLTFLGDKNPQPRDWADVQPVVVGAIIVSALHEAKHTQRSLVQGAHVFARYYSLPAMTEALGRTSGEARAK